MFQIILFTGLVSSTHVFAPNFIIAESVRAVPNTQTDITKL